ncbi:MAG: Na+/H+ antiporter [Candidatus Melainabacteria bacterium]|nr:Na+/H+ antiporter [Candidatus Melainabacteria bacterium]
MIGNLRYRKVDEQVQPGFHIDILVVLLLVASAVAIAVKWVKLPYSIALVMVGLVIGVCHVLPAIEMTPELILVVFLPALLFEASWNLELGALRGNWLPISTLASVGVVVSMLAIGVIMHFWGGVNLGAAFLFGAMISATDPISVIALFRKMGIDKRMTMLLEGESLFNDGTAVVLFKLVLALVVVGAGFSVPATVGSFLMVIAGGVLVGLVLGYAASQITSYFDDHLLEITLTTILAYGSYLVAEQLKVSPVIAVVTAGIYLGNYGSRIGMSATTRLAVNSFWEYAAFVVNSLVFLLIGLQVKFELLVKYLPLIGIGIVSILVARLIVVYGLCPFASTRLSPIPWTWRHLLFWGALRGSLCMALALSLPLSFPARESIIIITFGVVLFTLLVQGLTIEPLVTWLKMEKADPRLSKYQALKTELMIQGNAMSFLKSLLKSEAISRPAFEQLTNEIGIVQEELRRQIASLHLADVSIQEMEVNETRKRILEVSKDYLIRLAREGVVSDEILQKLRTDIDCQIYELVQKADSLVQESAHSEFGAGPASVEGK